MASGARRCFPAVALAFFVIAAGCAGPRAAGEKGPVAVSAPAAVPVPPPAEEIESFALLRDEPAIADASRRLDAATDKSRPALLLARARTAIAGAQQIRTAQGNPIKLPGWAPDYEKFLAYYDLAYRDLEELVARYPRGPEAPEGRFLLGLIHDYPHLDLFDEALARYRLTIEMHPGTEWAGKAAARIQVIESIMDGVIEGPHGGQAP